MKKIRLGHIGIAHGHSRGIMECVRKHPDIFEIVGIAEPDEKLCEAFKDMNEYKGLTWMSEAELFARDVDAVLVEGFELDLVQIAQRCIDRGVHVHIDKPAGDDMAAFERLLRDAKKKKLVLQMAYMYRYNPAVRFCRERIRDGTLGEIYEVDAIMNTEHSVEKRKWLGNFKGGVMFFLGCHMVDLVYLMQGMPNNITVYNRTTGFDGINAVDHGFAVFEYDRGVSTVRVASTEINGYGRRQLVVCGSKGTIEIKPLERETKAALSVSSRTNGRCYFDIKDEIKFKEPRGRYDDMMLDFAAFVRGEKKNPFDYEYELELQKLILKSCGQDIDFKKRTEL